MVPTARGDARHEGGFKRLRIPRISLWVIAFGIGTAFQIWRGATSDAVIFGIATTFLIVNSYFVHQESTWKLAWDSRLVGEEVLIPLVSLIGITLYLSPLHGAIQTWIFLILALVVLTLTWFSDRPEVIRPDASIFLSAKVWASLGVLTSIWEVLNYVLAGISHDDRTYPTISDLVDPVLRNHLGKMVFLMIWIFTGITFLKPARTE